MRKVNIYRFIGICTAIILFLSCLGVAQADNLTFGAVAYWSYDNANISGTNVKEYFTNWNGTIGGVGAFDTGYAGKVGQAVNFSNDYVITTNQQMGTTASSFSIMGWVYTTNSSGLEYSPFGTGANVLDCSLRLNVGNTNGSVRFEVAGSTTGQPQVSGLQYTSPNTWNFWAITKNRTGAGAAIYKLYFNGTLVATSTSITDACSNPASTIQMGRIGATTDTPYTTAIDEVLLYNYTVNDSVVQAVYSYGMNNTQYPFTTSGAVSNVNVSVGAVDAITLVGLNTFNATMNGNFFSTTNGTINTNITNGTIVNISVSAANYFSASYTNVNTANSVFIANLTPYASIIGSDTYDSNTIPSITVQYNGTNYTGNPARVPVGQITFNATIFAPNYFNYSITNGNGTNQSLNASMYQAVALFNSTEFVTNTQNAFFTVTTDNGKNSNGSVPQLLLRAGTYNITFNDTGWYNTTFSIIVPLLSNQTYNLANTYRYLLNITAKNNITNTFDNSFYAIINSSTFNFTTITNTTNGSIITPWYNDSAVNITILNSTTIASTSVIRNLSGNTTPALINITLSGYSTNTLFFNIFDEQTLAKITLSTTLNLVGNNTQYNFTTTTGSYNATLLNPQTYLITASTTGYFPKTYIYTLLNQTTAVQNIYLLNNTNTNTGLATTFTVTDLSAIPLDSVLVVSQKLINTTYITISSQYTDFAGQALASYDTTQFYTVIFSKNGYITKSVTFKPVSTGYTVRLVGSTTSIFTSQIGDITYSFNPVNFTLPLGIYNFTFTTASPSGSINTFGMNYAGIRSTSNGNTGGTVNITLDLSGANNNYQSYPFSYFIIDIYNNTFNFSNSYTIYNQSTPTNSTITQAISNANFSTGGGIILAVGATVVVLLVLSTFIAGAFLGVVIGILAITFSALSLIPWTFGIMIALIMFFAAWARGR